MAKKTFQSQELVEGIIKRHPDGFGFFVPDRSDLPDVYLSKKEMFGVMTNDRLLIRAIPERGTERWRGERVKILSRANARVVGQFFSLGKQKGLLHDRSHGWGEDLNVTFSPQLEIGDGDWVVVQIISYPGEEDGFKGEVVSVIGDAQNPLNDAMRVLHQHSIPNEFSQKTLKEVKEIPQDLDEKEFHKRADLRSKIFVTIDGVTAKDFDDAICVSATSKGFHLLVAIADVSHYVKPGMAVDEEAYERGTSVYFPNFVSPMLPEVLSNDLCSLRPDVARLSMVADMHIDFNGELQRSEFYEAVIESKARITYGEAQEIIDGNESPSFIKAKEMILCARDLAKILMAKRMREGSIDLEIPETEIELDETGQPIDIIRSDRLFSHRLIEEMMLIANVAVARFFHSREIEALYRIHEPPMADRLMELERYLQAFGFKKSLEGGKIQKKLSQALEHFADQPQESILHILTLRTMSQAKYSPDNLGHFGLGFSFYTHFTSPIRRYPDLVVHRLLKALVVPKRGYHLISYGELQSIGTMTSAREQRAVKAERQVKSIKKARFMAPHLGEEFDGVISSVVKFGIFVTLRQFDVDGLIRIESLPQRDLYFDEENLRLIGKKSGVSYNIGDPVRVSVAKADIQEGKIDFLLIVNEEPSAQNISQKAQSTHQRRQAKRNRRRVRQTRVSRNRRKSKTRSVHS